MPAAPHLCTLAVLFGRALQLRRIIENIIKTRSARRLANECRLCAKAKKKRQRMRSTAKYRQNDSEPQRDPDYMAGWNCFRFTWGDFDRQNALFVLKYSTPAVLAPTSEEVDRCLGQLNKYTLTFDFDWENIEDVAAYDRLTRSTRLDDEDFEFMFRHAVLSPMMENMEI
ncbi:hypothetical protein K438DRAFT_1775751 [Mycena galopus ATCC 62051]|nr:hypothetical protein K438DRAFT_1775751 [Mycena galopus ATCC 62051]